MPFKSGRQRRKVMREMRLRAGPRNALDRVYQAVRAKEREEVLQKWRRDKPLVGTWGFDTTQFIDADSFMDLRERHGLSKPVKEEETMASLTGFGPTDTAIQQFVSRGKGVKLVMKWNPEQVGPETGPHAGMYRQKRIGGKMRYGTVGGSRLGGLAGYIGIEGDPKKVAALADDIRKTAWGIKDESPGVRSFI